MRTIAMINAKGGVGKTTSSMVFADVLSRKYGAKVLLIDLDPQLNTSTQMGVYEKGGLCVAHLLVDKDQDIEEVIKTSKYEGIDVIPCDKALEVANQQILMDTSTVQQLRLKKHIRKVQGRYDYCILDCPTAIKNISTINGLAFTDDVLVPMTADEYSLGGLNDILTVINDVSDYNDNIHFVGCFLTQFERANVCIAAKEHLKEALGDKAFDTHIRKAAKVKESTFGDKSLLDYAKDSTAVADYYELVEEYLAKRGE